MYKVKVYENGVLECQDKQVLTDSQFQKLKCNALIDQINAMCKDLHIEGRFVEEICNGNVKRSVITKMTDFFDNKTAHDLEMKHISFLSAIDKLELPAQDEENEEEDGEDDTEFFDEDKTTEFVKIMLHDLNLPDDDDESIIGALVMGTMIDPLFARLTTWGKISHDLLKEFCELYLKAHS